MLLLVLLLNWNAVVRLRNSVLPAFRARSCAKLHGLVRDEIRRVPLVMHHHLILIWDEVALRAGLGRLDLV